MLILSCFVSDASASQLKANNFLGAATPWGHGAALSGAGAARGRTWPVTPPGAECVGSSCLELLVNQLLS